MFVENIKNRFLLERIIVIFSCVYLIKKCPDSDSVCYLCIPWCLLSIDIQTYQSIHY